MRDKLDAIILISLLTIGLLGFISQYTIPQGQILRSILICQEEGGVMEVCLLNANVKYGTPLTRMLGI